MFQPTGHKVPRPLLFGTDRADFQIAVGMYGRSNNAFPLASGGSSCTGTLFGLDSARDHRVHFRGK